MNRLGRKMMLRFAGLGDAVFLNSIAYYYWRHTGQKVILAGNYPEIFHGNPGAWVLPTSSQKIAHQIGRLLVWTGLVDSLTYMGYQPEGKETIMKPLPKHILTTLGEKVGLTEVPLVPKIFLTPKELKAALLPQTGKPWVAMHSTGVTDMTQNKNWYPERFVEVAKEVRKKFRLVQLGVATDPKLDSDMDLRNNCTPRKAAAVLASCVACVCQEGYLMHAATAVGTPTVAIYGGFIAPWESGYDKNTNLFTSLECSPCWKREVCPYDRKCMKQISADDVLKALDNVVKIPTEC